MRTSTFRVASGDELVTEIGEQVAAFAREVGGDGLLHVFAPHATAGLALLETGSGSERDLEAAIDRMLPPDAPYAHRHGSPGHGRDHLLPTFVSPSLVLAVVAGDLQLGTWQSIVLVDPNRDNPERTIRLSLVAG